MRIWDTPLHPGLKLTLAADARLTETSYLDDQVWELSAGGGEPPALAIQTTYGLRARAMRILPRFTENEQSVMDASEFSSPVKLRRFYPNYLLLNYAPFPEIDVQLEFWVPTSQSLGGRLLITNQSKFPRQLRFDLAALLTPIEGERMAPAVLNSATVLAGSSGGLFPVVFMTGGAQARHSPFPSLSMDLALLPGESGTLKWFQAALGGTEASFTLAQSLASHNWEAETARIELLNSSQLEIYSGRADWDFALALAQRNATALLQSRSPHLPHISFVQSRQPDQGYSMRGDGLDHPPLHSGYTPLDLLYMAQFLLPGSAPLLQNLIRNFIHIQAENGFIDLKPGVAGQRSGILATPLLAGIAWQAYQNTQDRNFLEEIFPGLVKFVDYWFSAENDRDQDGIPEFSHPSQIGFEDHPIFSYWHSWSQGVDISKVESPALCAMLYAECSALIQIANSIGNQEALSPLEKYSSALRSALAFAWNPDAATYQYWDRDTHQSPSVEKLGQRNGPGIISLHHHFEQPARLLLRIHADSDEIPKPNVTIHGVNTTGQHRIERLTEDQFRWHLGLGTHTGDRVYQSIEELDIQGVSDQDYITLYRVGFCCPDQTVILPLWAGMSAEDEAQEIIEYVIKNPDLYWHAHGIPLCPQRPPGADSQACLTVNMLWNSLTGLGLLNYNNQDLAVELTNRLMDVIIRNLEISGGFRNAYHADSGQGFGERDMLHGFPPLGLFLRAAGIQIVSEKKVIIMEKHPFPWPLTVKYRRLTVLRQKDKTVVIFPDGQTSTVEGSSSRVVSLEAISQAPQDDTSKSGG